MDEYIQKTFVTRLRQDSFSKGDSRYCSFDLEVSDGKVLLTVYPGGTISTGVFTLKRLLDFLSSREVIDLIEESTKGTDQ